MRLSENFIKKIENQALSHLENLERFYIGRNSMSDKVFYSFELPANLLTIMLDHNSIETLNEKTFINLTRLQTINFWNNKLNHVSPKAFANLNFLKVLDLRKNVCINNIWEGKDLMAIQKQLSFSICHKCLVPQINHGRGVEFVYQKNYTGGNLIKNLQTLKVVCDEDYALVLDTKYDGMITCKNEGWNKKFPECISEYFHFNIKF